MGVVAAVVLFSPSLNLAHAFSRFTRRFAVLGPAAVLAAAACGCSGPTGSNAVPPGGSQRLAGHAHRATSPAAGKISHVVIVIQENRTLDNLFNGYCNPGGHCANTVSSATIVPTPPPSEPSPLPTPTTVPLVSVGLEAPYDINHGAAQFVLATDTGKMDEFNWEGGQNTDGSWWGGVGCPSGCAGYTAPQYPELGYVPPSEIHPYTAIADSYVLFDNFFASNIDASFVAHQFLIAGQAGGTPSGGGSATDVPNGLWGCGGGPSDLVPTLTLARTYGQRESPCFDYQTLGDELDGAGLSWAYYAPAPSAPGYIWSAYQAVNHIVNGPNWSQHVLSPQSKVIGDVKAGRLAAVTWVVPTPGNSDHPGLKSKKGPAWVASVVNAIGKSAFWKSTAVFVLWDDWGGWYDHVNPPTLDYMGLGLRVPLLVVSPYALAGSITSTCDPSGGAPYEFGSVLRFTEDLYGLSQLAASDTRAPDPAYDSCVFNFSQQPRKFKSIPASLVPGNGTN